MDYLRLYNHHIPQSSLGYLTPIQSLKKWQESHPHLFVKSVYNETKPDKVIISDTLIKIFSNKRKSKDIGQNNDGMNTFKFTDVGTIKTSFHVKFPEKIVNRREI